MAMNDIIDSLVLQWIDLASCLRYVTLRVKLSTMSLDKDFIFMLIDLIAIVEWFGSSRCNTKSSSSTNFSESGWPMIENEQKISCPKLYVIKLCNCLYVLQKCKPFLQIVNPFLFENIYPHWVEALKVDNIEKIFHPLNPKSYWFV